MKAQPALRPRSKHLTALAATLPALIASGLLFAQDKTEPAPAAEVEAKPEVIRLTPPVPKGLADAKSLAVSTYAKIVEATYHDALTQAIQMRKDIQTLITVPTAFHHLSAKLAWLEARMPYLQTEAFRFYGGPIDGEGGPEGLLNAWPLDEVYIDYVEGSPTAGIIGDVKTYPELTPEVLAALNEAGGERNVATGYHAIEFLLWGQDTSPTSAGKRTHDDYKSDVTKNAGRRGLYLLACSDLLVRQLAALHSEWVAGKDNYRAGFEKLPADEALQKILTGAGMLAGFELSGERLGVAYETMEQEEEQSCFSDTTHIDMLHNTAGIANLVAGAYVGVDGRVDVIGVGLATLADNASAERGLSLRAATNAAMKAANAIDAPFDQQILDTNPEGRAKVKALIDALNTLAGEISGLAGDLGLKISIAEGE